MQLAKVQLETGEIRVAIVEDGHVRCLNDIAGLATLSDILHSNNPASVARDLMGDDRIALQDVTLQAPIDHQEVWAAGVTYKRSQEARERESEGAARFYDLVYSAPRPELFFKANPHRVVGTGGRVHIRRDSHWNVPEPELALVVSPRLQLVGYTIGNDMSSRDIEGENPLYLPQAKVYDNCCSLGPVITLVDSLPNLDQVTVKLTIQRKLEKAFEGTTTLAQMKRTPSDLIDWLGREASFPTGVILLTGTGIVPPDDFTLAAGDIVHIDMSGIGRLTNVVAQRK